MIAVGICFVHSSASSDDAVNLVSVEAPFSRDHIELISRREVGTVWLCATDSCSW